MNWRKIRLELADTREYPRGSVSRGYLICAPLTANGAVDENALTEAPHRAIVRRFWSTEPDENGRFVRLDGHWVLRCDGKPDRLIAVNKHPFRVGARVDVVDPDGVAMPFRVASVGRFDKQVLPS